LFNPVDIETVLVGHEVNGETQMTKASGTTNSVKIGLRVLGEIKVDDDIDSLNVNTTCEQIRTNEIPADTIAEIVEDAIAVRLKHLRMGIET
jgi:hypothetical protein